MLLPATQTNGSRGYCAASKVINEAFSHYPDYQWNEQQKVKLRADLYKLLYSLCGWYNQLRHCSFLSVHKHPF
jgi:hypothetical protein